LKKQAAFAAVSELDLGEAQITPEQYDRRLKEVAADIAKRQNKGIQLGVDVSAIIGNKC
jgi:hypothetical protein